MLTIYDLMVFKESLGNEKIIHVVHEHLEFVFRIITPKEYNQARMLTSSTQEMNDAICQLCLIYPQSFSFVENPCGCVSDEISREILSASLIGEDDKLIDLFEEYKSRNNNFLSQCMLFIKAAFPEYKMEEIESWSFEKILSMTAKAEYIFKIKGINSYIEYDKESLAEIKAEKEKITEFDLLEKQIDPMFYFSDKIILKQPLVPIPVIAGSSWTDEKVLRDVQQQILSRR